MKENRFKIDREKIKVISICMSESYLKKLDELCIDKKLNRSEMIRTFIKEKMNKKDNDINIDGDESK